MFKGKFKLVKKHVDTGDVTYESDWIDNNVTLTHIQDRMFTNTPSATSRIGPNIVISNWDGPVSERVNDLINCFAIGTNVTAPTFNGDPNIGTPYFVEYQQTFSPPGTDRDINSIGVTNSSLSGGSCEVDAWTALGATCTQTTIETLIVFYRIQFDAKIGNQFNTDRQADFAQAFGLGTTSRIFPVETVHTWQSDLHNVESGLNVPGVSGPGIKFLSGQSNLYSGTDIGPDATFDPLYFARRYSHSATISDSVGQVRGSIVYRTNNGSNSFGNGGYWNNLLTPSEGKVQNIYSHNSSALVPFFDPLTVPTTDGTIAISSTAWTDPDYPFHYRIEITNTGAVGVSEYRFMRRRLVGGYQGNSYRSAEGPSPISSTNDGALGGLSDNSSGTVFVNAPNGERGEVPHTYNNRTLFMCDNSGMVFIDVITGELKSLINNATFPAWNATAIAQFEYDDLSDTVWVTCQDTGIYSVNDPLGTPVVAFHDITAATGTIVGPLANQAYAIDLGVSQGGFRTVWAIVEGALVQSVDNGVTWAARDNTTAAEPFTQPFIEANWSRAIAIRAHKSNANDELGFMYNDGTTLSSAPAVFVSWWDRVNDTQDPFNHASESVLRQFGASQPYSNENKRMVHRMFGMTPTQGRWVMNGTGSTGLSSVADNNSPIWFTYGQGNVGITDHPGLPNGGRSPQFAVNSTQRSTNHVEYGVDDAGQDFIFFMNEGGSDVYACDQAGGTTLIYANTDLETQPDSLISDGWVAYMGNGIFFGYNNTNTVSSEGFGVLFPYGRSSQPLGPTNFSNELWEDFGWDGTNWVIGNVNNKVTHAGAEVLVDGLTIAFDDNGATQTFDATDYFTAGVINGVQLDANTEYDWEGSLYLQPSVQGITELEPNTVPGATTLLTTPSNANLNRLTDYVDTTGNIVLAQLTSTPATGDDITKTGTAGVEGTRLNQPSEGDFNLIVDALTESDIALGDGTIFGVSNVSIIGAGLNRDTVQYGFYISGGLTSLADVTIRESGVDVAVVETGLNMAALLQGLDMRIERVGTTINYYFMDKLVHTTLGTPAVSMIPEFVIGNGADARLFLRSWEHTWTDTWSYIGTSVATSGSFDPLLRVVDILAKDYSLTIAATEGTDAGARDRNTVLGAGEYVVFPETGAVRFAAADATGAIAGNFTVLQSS